MSPVVLASEGAFTWLGMLPFLHGEGARFLPVAHATLTMVLLLVGATMARSALMKRPEGREGLVPDADLKPRNVFELLTEGLLNMIRGIIPHHAERYFPLIAGIFVYIFINNLMGVIPGMAPPHADLSANIGMALVVFVYYNYHGVREQGLFQYLKHFLGPVWYLAWMMVVIEIISHLVRPASLSIRLYGNISGDHLVLDIFLNALPETISMVLGYVIPAIFIGLGVFVSFMQAFVFSLLAAVYVAFAVAHDN
jgi:F-type H+-transporting ATPase subunit a